MPYFYNGVQLPVYLSDIVSASNLLINMQMIESSAHGDEYDGVIFSQLVWFRSLSQKPIIHFTLSVVSYFFGCRCLQNLIDLAGSESSKTETTGLRRKEGSYINKSLLTLGTVRALQINMLINIYEFHFCAYFCLEHYLLNLLNLSAQKKHQAMCPKTI